MTVRPVALVAEDDGDLRVLVSTRLEELGFDVVAAGDGDEALRLARTRSPEIAVLDVAMPGLDGLEVTRRLRAHDPGAPSVILLTARSSEDDVVAGYEAGAVDYIRKPFSSRVLAEAVRRVQDRTAANRVRAEVEERAGIEAAVARVAANVAADAPPRAVAALVVREIAALLPVQGARVLTFTEKGRARVVASWRAPGLPPATTGRDVVVGGGNALDLMVRAGRPAAARIDGTLLPHRLAVPVQLPDGNLWGAVAVGAASDTLGDGAVTDVLQRFAHLVGIAVSGAESRVRLAAMASTDHLTGLPNMRAFRTQLDREVDRAHRRGREVSLIVLDLDHFKRVNDTHGHDAGNRVLREAADRLRALVRSGEMVARVGGEEFAWILPDAGEDAAVLAAERAREAIARRPFPEAGPLTISAGVRELGARDDADDLFRAADAALYRAKQTGRNRVCRYVPAPAPPRPPADPAAERRAALAAFRAVAVTADARAGAPGRSARVAETAARIARAAGWEAARIALLHEAALVRDVGLVAGDPAGHAATGALMLAGVLSEEQVAWVRAHHERHDGDGVPDGLAGDAVPEGARLLAVAEEWVRLSEPPGTPDDRERALARLVRQAGAALDPDTVQALRRVVEA